MQRRGFARLLACCALIALPAGFLQPAATRAQQHDSDDTNRAPSRSDPIKRSAEFAQRDDGRQRPSYQADPDGAALGIRAVRSDDPGVKVAKVYPDGPAHDAGILVMDHILAVDGRKVSTVDELSRLIASKKPRSALRMRIRHATGQEETVVVTLGTRESALNEPSSINSEFLERTIRRDLRKIQRREGLPILRDQDEVGVESQQGGTPKRDARRQDASDRAQSENRASAEATIQRRHRESRLVDSTKNNDRSTPERSDNESVAGIVVTEGRDDGIVVVQVRPNSSAAAAGIRVHDSIVAVDGREVTSPRDLVRALRQRDPGSTIELRVARNGRTLSTTLRPPALPGQPSSTGRQLSVSRIDELIDQVAALRNEVARLHDEVEQLRQSRDAGARDTAQQTRFPQRLRSTRSTGARPEAPVDVERSPQ